MTLPEKLNIPCSKSVQGEIRIPGSKSISNRAILIASLADGVSSLEGLLYSDDTHYMMKACENLGSTFKQKHECLEVKGCNGELLAYEKEIYIGNAGTAARFLTAALTLGQGRYELTGNERMQQRPIVNLIDALNDLGCNVTDSKSTGCPPVRVIASGMPGGTVRIRGDQSSQYISAILLMAPYAQKSTTINIIGSLVSKSYVEMTMRLMKEFGVRSQWVNEKTIKIDAQQNYQARAFSIEGDASSASYFFGMAAITGGRIKVTGMEPNSTQGDLGLIHILEKMGCKVHWEKDGVVLQGRKLKAVDVDMNTMSDVAPTLAVVALFAEGTTRINNVGNMRIKECDRISATAKELKKLGAQVEEWDTGLSITGQKTFQSAEFETYDDHRMAMSLSLVGLKVPDIVIKNPQCVTKTFPMFFDMFLPLIRTV